MRKKGYRVMKEVMKFGVAAAAFVAMGLAASASQAAVYIGLSLNGGPITTVLDVDPNPDVALFTGGFGSFNINLTTGSFPGGYTLLDSTTSNVSTSTPGTLDVYVTRDDISTPVNLSFLSSFTTNQIPTGWTIRQRTYVDTSNAQFGTANLLGDWTAPGSNTQSVQFALPVPGAGPYSVTSRFTIAATGAGSSLSTVTLTAVPEPGTWALMILGFGGAGAMLRSRRRQAAALA